MSNGIRHFLDLIDIPKGELQGIIAASRDMKDRGPSAAVRPLAGKTLAMIFDKPSTRTRVSFDVGIRQLGGESITLTGQEMQLGRGETIADTARVLSRYVDGIVIRTLDHKMLEELAANATIPVINGLTRRSHPCQVMADVMTFEEHKGPIAGRAVAWLGDGNNVAESWVQAAARFGFNLRVACPQPCGLPEALLAWAREQGADVSVTSEPEAAVRGADCVVTDTWLSMANGNAPDMDRDMRLKLLTPYRVDERLMGLAKPDAIFMHCLPASRDREVSAAVIDGPQSVVWDEAENRVHAQKGILQWCLT